MGARVSLSRAVWLSAAAALAVPTGCAGRSTTLDTESAGGDGSGGTGGAGGRASGGTGGTGKSATGGTGATGSGATGSGATGATGSGATGSGATGATGSGATGGTGLGGGGSDAGGAAGMGPSCSTPPLAERTCHEDSECRLTAPVSCCGPTPVHGVNVSSMCADPVLCVAECAGPTWLTDSMESTLNLAEVRVRCDIGEPGAGVCLSYIDLEQTPQPTYCGESVCTPTEVCVHYAPPGGPPPPCELPFDGGGCAGGWELGICPSTGQMGCVRLPPGPACALAGASCGGTVTCDCLPPDICGGVATECTGVMGRDVACIDMSP